jgi:hypothetical protein
MFGLGKVFSGFFESIGLGWMGSVVSLAANFMMGNWAGVAQDIFRLVSEFSNDSWASRVDRFQPLGSFGRGSCFGDGNTLSSSRINELWSRSSDDAEVAPSVNRSLGEVSYAVSLKAEVDTNRWMANGTAKA